MAARDVGEKFFVTSLGPADADLAASLGMRLNTFLQNVTRARELLAECLQKHGVLVDPELAS